MLREIFKKNNQKIVQILGYIDETSDKLEVKEEGKLIKYSTHISGRDGYIKSYDVALVQLDNGAIKSVSINMIRVKS